MNLDLECLETFVLLAECGSCSRAARCQTITQPAVSRRIARLESETGLRLFVRDRDGLRLTRDGSSLHGVARGILGEHENLSIRMARHQRVVRGGVRVMIDCSAHGDALAARLAGEADERREILRATGGVCWQDALRRQVVDLVVTGRFLRHWDQSAFAHHDLMAESGINVAWNRDYFELDPDAFRFDAVLRHTWLLPSASLVPGFRPFLEKLCMDSHGVTPGDVRECDRDSEAADRTAAGIGIALAPGDFHGRAVAGRPGIASVRVFQVLLPDAYGHTIFVRNDETAAEVIREVRHIRSLFAADGCAQLSSWGHTEKVRHAR